MIPFQNISNIDINIREGRYLIAAIAILTATSDLRILNKEINGSETSPDKMLDHLYESQQEIFKNAMPIPEETIEQPVEFQKALSVLINQYSLENGSNTPDFILAKYLDDCLEVYDKALKARDKWFGIDAWSDSGKCAKQINTEA